MSDRGKLVETAIKKRLLDTQKHVDTLIYALSKVGGESDSAAFVHAWSSDAHEERVLAYAVQSGYENAINGVIKIAQELCELEHWTPANQEPGAAEALNKLRGQGLIDAKMHTQLKNAYEDRGRLQHDYTGTLANDIHKAALAAIDAVPQLVQDVALYIKQRNK